MRDDPRMKWVRMDVTSEASVADVAKRFDSTVDWVICASGVNANRRLARYDDAAARREMETNFFGLIRLFQAFAPALCARRAGAFVNILSVLSLVNHPMMATYCASKAAANSLTQAMRAELAPFGVKVHAVMPPVVDTGMSAHVPHPKMSPAEVAQAMITGLEAGMEDIYPGHAKSLRDALQEDWKSVERSFASKIAPV